MNKKNLQKMKSFKKLDLCPVIAGINKKGGVGKTMISCSIGAVAAYAGLRVLIIETCEQMNTVNLMAADRSVKNTEHLSFVDFLRNPNVDLRKLIIRSKVENLFIMPAASGMTEYFSSMFDGFEDGYKTAQIALQSLRRAFDLIIIDSPPADNSLPITAIAACTHYFFVADGDNNASDGIRQIQKTITKVCAKANPDIQCLGILMNDKMKNPAVCSALIGSGGEPPFNYLNYMIPYSKKPISFAIAAGDNHWLRNGFKRQSINSPIEEAIYDFTHFIMVKTGLIEEETFNV